MASDVRRARLGWCTGAYPQCSRCPGRVESSAGYAIECDCRHHDEEK